MGERVCGGRRRGPHLGRDGPRRERSRRRGCAGRCPSTARSMCEPKSSALDWVSEIAEPVGVDGAQVCGVAVADARPPRGQPSPDRAQRRGAPPAPPRTRAAAAAASRSGASSAAPSAPSKSTSGRSWPDGAPRLDEQVRPERVVGLGARGRPRRRRPRRPASGSPARAGERSTGRAPRRGRAAARTTAPSSCRGRPRRSGPGPAPSGPVRTRRRRSRSRPSVGDGAQGARDARAGAPAAPPRAGRRGRARRRHRSAWTRWLASASMMEAEKPSSASSTAGASTSARGRRPKRAWRDSHPSTAPGTCTLRTSPRSGIVAMPSARMRAGSDPAPARPMESSARGAEPGGATMASTSPPSPHRCGPTTAIAAPVATAASAADPPRSSMPIPAEAASWSAAATMPRRPRPRAEGREGEASHHDDRAQDLAPLHAGERVLHLVDPDRLAHEAVEVEAPVEVEVDEHREVA